jgi:hypothetical protein
MWETNRTTTPVRNIAGSSRSKAFHFPQGNTSQNTVERLKVAQELLLEYKRTLTELLTLSAYAPTYVYHFIQSAGRSGKLLLVFASTVNPGFRSHWDPWSYFCSFQDFYIIWNGTFFPTRGRVCLLHVTQAFLGILSSDCPLTRGRVCLLHVTQAFLGILSSERSLTRGRVCLLHVTQAFLGILSSERSLTNWLSPPRARAHTHVCRISV